MKSSSISISLGLFFFLLAIGTTLAAVEEQEKNNRNTHRNLRRQSQNREHLKLRRKLEHHGSHEPPRPAPRQGPPPTFDNTMNHMNNNNMNMNNNNMNHNMNNNMNNNNNMNHMNHNMNTNHGSAFDAYGNHQSHESFVPKNNYYYNDPYNDPYAKKPSDRPTPRPTPLPSDRPTPYPTPYPTPSPTRHPTKHPTRNPTREPTPESSHEPSMSSEPSEEPTNSEEPSNHPSESEEPTNFPSESLEPSQQPSESTEPSQFPSASFEPTPDDLLTLADVICDDQNVNLFGLLCALIRSSPSLFAILDNEALIDPTPFLGIPNFDPAPFSNNFRNFNQPRVPNLGGFRRDLQDDKYVERQMLTIFAPTNSAINRFLFRGINELFDQTDDDVVEFFESIELDITDDSICFKDFLLSKDGSLALNEILLTHIINKAILSKSLRCNKMYVTLSGQDTVTSCLKNKAKYQLGEGNSSFDKPRIFGTDYPASNGLLHVIDEMIIPELSIPGADFVFPDDPHGILLVNSALLNGAPILFTADPTESPKP